MSGIDRVIQLVPAFHYGDAIGESIRNLVKWLKKKGINSEVYALEVDSEISNEAFIYWQKQPKSDEKTVVMLHYALPSVLNEVYMNLGGKKVLVYHNITPAEYFLPWNAELAYLTNEGRKQLINLSKHTDLGLADSNYNRMELEAVGYRKTMVCPIWVPINQLSRGINKVLLRSMEGRTVFIFVGRVVPNKKIEDIIKIVFWYRENIDSTAILVVIGKNRSVPRYYYWLREYGKALHYSEEELIFTGHIAYEDLAAYYKGATAFISMSEHEGFCVPLVESMYFGLPIVAYASAAVPEILGGAGILVYNKRFEYIAELLSELSKDEQLRQKVIESEKERINYFNDENMFKIWDNIFCSL
jgi:glycosyltransferase involved in cell wall biosynthesis